jgi:hypothetical protein
MRVSKEPIVAFVLLMGAIAICVAYVWSASLAVLDRAEDRHQLEKYVHTNFPTGSVHELETYGTVEFKRHREGLYNTGAQVTFWTQGDDRCFLSGESVTMSWRLFQELLIEEKESEE